MSILLKKVQKIRNIINNVNESVSETHKLF